MLIRVHHTVSAVMFLFMSGMVCGAFYYFGMANYLVLALYWRRTMAQSWDMSVK